MNSLHRKASRAKRYQADPMAMFRAFGRALPFTAAEQAKLNLPVRVAFQAFIDRTAKEGDFHTLAGAVNVAMVCAESIDPLVEQTCTAARDALMRVHTRQIQCGQWGLDGPAFAEIELAIDVYEQLTGLLTGGQLKDAMSECIRRMQAGDVLQPLQ